MFTRRNCCWAGIVAVMIGRLAPGIVHADAGQMPPEQVVEVRGQKICFPEAGQGAAIVLLRARCRRRAWKFIEANKRYATEDLAGGAFERHLKSGDGYTIASTVANIVLHNQFVDSKLGSIRAPTLVIWGSEDALIPLSFGERFHKGISGSRLVVMKNCGHLPQMQKRKEFNKVLIKFLKQ